MSTQVVRPAGAGHETLWVLLACACVLTVAAILIGTRAQPLAEVALSPHQIDARTQLNAAEQGVHADLLVAAEEIVALALADRAPPTVEHLRDMALPPFATGMGAAARGGHEWRIAAQAGALAYVGLSAAPDVAASFLLHLPPLAQRAASDGSAHPHEGPAAVWVHREGPQTWPESLDGASLTRQGWREVVVRYDAGVTRQNAAH